jgi:hypothetical protein
LLCGYLKERDMRTNEEIKKCFKNNFKRDINIFSDWIKGFTIHEIAKNNSLSESHIKQVAIKRGYRAVMFSNKLSVDDLPYLTSIKEMPDYKSVYEPLIVKALSI